MIKTNEDLQSEVRIDQFLSWDIWKRLRLAVLNSLCPIQFVPQFRVNLSVSFKLGYTTGFCSPVTEKASDR